MIAAGGNVEHRIEACRLTGGSQHCGGTALKLGNLFCNIVVGWVLKAGVKIAGGFQIKEFAHVRAGRVLEGGALNNRELTRLAIPRRIAALHTFCADA